MIHNWFVLQIERRNVYNIVEESFQEEDLQHELEAGHDEIIIHQDDQIYNANFDEPAILPCERAYDPSCNGIFSI